MPHNKWSHKNSRPPPKEVFDFIPSSLTRDGVEESQRREERNDKSDELASVAMSSEGELGHRAKGGRAFAVPGGGAEQTFSTDEHYVVEDEDYEDGMPFVGSGGRRSVCVAKAFDFCRKQWTIVVLTMCCIALGASLLVTKKNEGGANWKHGPLTKSQRYEAVQSVLETVTAKNILEDSTTPQHRAFVWIASEDERRVDPKEDPDHLIQRYAVATCFFATGGADSWEKDYGFLAFEHECNWNGDVSNGDSGKGVFCKGSNVHTITEVALPMNGLSGSIPDELGLLVEVTSIKMWDNEAITGSIPDTIKNLVHLEEISIDRCQLSGSIPPMGELKELRTISMQENALSGTVPEKIWALEKLEHLYLSSNNLSGSISSLIAYAKSLDELWLSENRFTGTLPTQLSNLPDLGSVFLQGNQLSGTIPESYGNLKKLSILDVGNNNIHGQLPASLWGLENIVRLSFAANALTGTIPVGGPMHKLRVFGLEENKLTGSMPDWLFFQGSQLVTLSLANNQLTGNIPESIKSVAFSTRDLDLSDNELGGSIPWDSMRSMNNLERLHLQGNNLLGPISPNISDMSALYELDLSRNHEMDGPIPSDTGRLMQLTKLNLANNALSGSLPPEISGAANLQTLDLHGNSLTGTVPSDFEKLKRLRHLVLSQNQFSGSLPLKNMVYLSHAELDENDFKGFIPEEIGSVKNLQHLSLSSNKISGTIPNEMNGLKGLTTFIIGRNSIGGSLPFDNLLNLKKVDARENKLSGGVPAGLFTPKLEYLDLSRNSFDGTLPATVGKSVDLQVLDLSVNKCSGALPPELGRAHDLSELLLADNDFTGTLPESLGELTKVTNLELSKNKFSGNVPQSLVQLKHLATLELSDNDLSGSLDFMCIGGDSGLKLFSSDCYGDKPETLCECCTLCCEDSDGDGESCHQN